MGLDVRLGLATHLFAMVLGGAFTWWACQEPHAAASEAQGDPHPSAELTAARETTSDGRSSASPATSPPHAFVSDAGVDSVSSPCPSAQERVTRTMRHFNNFLAMQDLQPAASESPEAFALGMGPYVDGWADALVHSDPTAVHEIAEQINAQFCFGGHQPGTTLMLLSVATRFAAQAPELRDGLTCILRSSTEENIVLWRAMDLWAIGQYADEGAFDALRARAHDERTLVRLGSLDARPAQEP